MRAAAAYRYLASDSDVLGSPATPGIVPDALIDAIYGLNSTYRAGASWIMNSATTGAVRKLKTEDGVYHWQPGLQAGQPAMLLGYPVNTWENMPDIGVIGFGNWRRAYVLVERVSLRITRDNVTNPGFVHAASRGRHRAEQRCGQVHPHLPVIPGGSPATHARCERCRAARSA
jgi:HK97 family phage major capsid protein